MDPVKASVGHLLSKAYSIPCSAAAQAFSQLVQPNFRFQLALDALLPLLSPPTNLDQRILASYILYALYAPHPILINPFKSVLFNTFINERDIGENEQLVWVLWKILKGDGNDIGPYSPSTLARSPLPPKLKASNLTLDEDTYKNDAFDVFYNDLNSNLIQKSTAETLKNGVDAEKEKERVIEPAEHENIARAMNLILAARERVLTLSEQRILTPLIPPLTSTSLVTSLDLAPLVMYNPSIAFPLFVSLLSAPNYRHQQHQQQYLDVLRYLPPTLPAFDLLGRLFRDTTPIEGHAENAMVITVGELVRLEVLGWFVRGCVDALDRAEKDEKEGLTSDDRFAKGVQNLCRFFRSLIAIGVVDPSSDAESVEMSHFALKNSRFEDANSLYRTLVAGKF